MAKQQGRRSLADLNAAQFISVIQPTRTLSAAEMKVWHRAVSSFDSSHWVDSDADLLTAYCSAVVWQESLRKDGDIHGFEKLSRVAMAYATKLRMMPQSRYGNRAAAADAELGRENEAAEDNLLKAWN